MSRESRKRALEEISNRLTRCTDADKDLPFLSNAPLMAVVELVQVLDEAGLLVDPDVADLDPDAPIPDTVSAPGPSPESREEALRRRIERACDACEDGDDLLAEVRKSLDEVEVSDEALELCEKAQEMGEAETRLMAAGYTGSVGWMVRDVLRDLVTVTMPDVAAAAPCEVHFVFEQKPDGDKVFVEAEVGGQSVSVGEWQPDPDEARYVRLVAQVVLPRVESPPAPIDVQTGGVEIRAARVPCPACGEGLTRDGECLNFPKCKNAIIPF